MRKIFSIRNGLIGMTFLTVILFTALVFTFIPYVRQPMPNANIDVIVRDDIRCDDGSMQKLCVPSNITAGEPFVYHTKGKKLVSNSASIQFQINCVIGNTENIVAVGNVPYSNIAAGNFDVNRTTTIPTGSKINASDKCTFQSIATYTFYQLDNNGNDQPIEIKEIATSNSFKLIVPTGDVSTQSSAPQVLSGAAVPESNIGQSSTSTPINQPVAVPQSSNSQQVINNPQPIASPAPLPSPTQTQPANNQGIVPTVINGITNTVRSLF